MLAVYCIGIVFRDRLKWILWAVLFSYVVLTVCISWKKGKWLQKVWKERRCLILLPVLLLLGAVLASVQTAEYPMDAVLTQKTVAQAQGRIRSITETQSGYRMVLNHIVINDFDTRGKLLVYSESAEGVQIGNYIRLEGELVPFSEPENAGQFDEKSYYRSQRIAYKFYADEIRLLHDGVDRIREYCRKIREQMDSIYEEILPEKHAGIVSAILLGDKAGLDEDTKALYQKNGIAHILAISGLHVSLLGMGLFSVIRRCGSPLIPAAAVTVMILMFYGFLTEFGVSTQRAVGMLILAMLAKILGRSYDSRSACAVCALMILLVNPMQLYQPGFQLSFVAAFGISYFNREWEQMKLQKGKTPFEKLAFLFLSSLTPQLLTAPVILNSYYELPVYSVFLNIPVVGLLSAVVFLSILAGAAGVFSYALGRFFVGGVYLVLELYEMLCALTEQLPFPIWLYGKPQSIRLIVYFAIIILFFIVAGRIGIHYRHHPRQHFFRRYAFFVLGLLPLVFFRIPDKDVVRDGNGCVVDFLSIGQGDCAVIRSGSGNAYLVDCGSTNVGAAGEYRLEPWLKYHGIAKLEAVFLSHPDSDHTNGVLEVLEKTNTPKDWYRGEIQIKNLVLPAAYRAKTLLAQEQTDGNAKGFENLIQLAEEKEIPIRWLETGDKVIEETLSFACLHPGNDYPTEDTNDASMVLLVECEKTAILFTGDVGTTGEEKIIRVLNEKAWDKKKTVILKVAHHGSKNSSSMEFLERLQPDVAVISCGKDNRFGHPHEDTLKRLKSVGSKIVSTPEHGTVTVQVGENVMIFGYRS